MTQALDLASDGAKRAVIVGRREDARDQLGDDVHFGLAHAAGGDRRRADANPARHHRRVLVERNRILVDRDASLAERGLRDKYDARPDYQRNDYLMWINNAKRDETKQKRLLQMLDELEAGGVYMKMKWNG